MKKYFVFLAVLIPLCGTGLHAQTNTNSFVVTAPAPVASTQRVVTTTSTSSLTVRTVVIDAIHQQMTIYFVGVAKPVIVAGADFATFQTTFQGQFAQAISAYLAAHPPTP